MAEIKSNEPFVGQIQIADEVIAIIAGTAALEVDGVLPGTSGMISAGDFVEKLGKKNLSKGVKVSVNENEAIVDLNILVKFGYKIQEVSIEVQKRVKNAVETMTGLDVAEVNVNISGVQLEKERPVKEEKSRD